MTKLNLNNLSSLQNEQSAISVINNNNDAIETFAENVLSRDGSTPNVMEAELDLNNNRIINLPPPVSPTEPIRVVDLDAVIVPSPVAGNVIGPVSSTPGDIVVFQGATGKLITDSGTTVGDITDQIDTKAPTDNPTFITKITSPSVVISKSSSPDLKFTDTTTSHSRSLKLGSDDKVYLTSTSDTNVVNVDNSGNITANAYYGDGTTLTGVETSSHASTTYSPIIRNLTAKTSNYTFVLGDGGNVIAANLSSAITFTVPPNSSVAFPTGTQIDLININTGKLTVSPGSGVTIVSPASLFSIPSSGTATLIKYATNSWMLSGFLVQ